MTIRPLEDPQEVTLDFEVELTPEFIEKYIADSGFMPSPRWNVSFNLTEVPDDLRGALHQAHNRYLSVEPFPPFPELTDDPEVFLSIILPWLDAAEAVEAEARTAQQDAEREEAHQSRSFLEEASVWARDHGSNRLRRALAGGYRANTTYAVERAAAELPGFWVDTAQDGRWGERSDPTGEALELEESVFGHLSIVLPDLSSRIVWLIEPPRSLARWLDDERGEEFEPRRP